MTDCHQLSSKHSIAARNISLHPLVIILLTFGSISPFLRAVEGTTSINNEGLHGDDAQRDSISSFTRLHRAGRVLFQEPDNSSVTNNNRPLAVKGGRLDPFDRLHKYRDGYDVKSKHYWGSVAYTGISGYALAVVWLLLGLLLAVSICFTGCWSRRQLRTQPAPNPPHVLYFWLAVFVVGLLTVAAIGSCVALYVGSNEFNAESRKVKSALSNAADNATETINLVAVAILDVEQLLNPFSSLASTLETLNSTERRLEQESQNIQHTVQKNKRVLDKIIISLEAVLIVVTTMNVILIILGPVCALLDWKRFFLFIVIAGWILTAVTAFLFGISFALGNFVADTCDAMNEYREDPYNTTLDALLPCQELLSASGALVDVAHGIRDSLTQVNDTINQLQWVLNYTLPPLCQPIGPPPSYSYLGSCPNDTTSVLNLAQEVEPLRCSSNDTQTCLQQGKILTDIQYMTVMAYASGASILLDVYPSITGLTNCSLVVNTFTELVDYNCKPAKSAVHLIWAGFLSLTTAMMLLILSWLVLTYRSRQRKLWRAIFPQVKPVWGNLKRTNMS